VWSFGNFQEHFLSAQAMGSLKEIAKPISGFSHCISWAEIWQICKIITAPDKYKSMQNKQL
jgi:hypothetical protein